MFNSMTYLMNKRFRPLAAGLPKFDVNALQFSYAKTDNLLAQLLRYRWLTEKMDRPRLAADNENSRDVGHAGHVSHSVSHERRG